MQRGEFPVFPPPVDETGIVGIGGQLTSNWLVAAYAQGVFPWPIIDEYREQLAWFSPDPRAILPLDQFRVSRRLARRLRRNEFTFSINRRFRDVIDACAEPRGEEAGVWLSPSMKEAYCRLQDINHLHTFEAWRDKRLVGGILVVTLAGLASAESMFHTTRDAGNAALAFMVQQLEACGYQLVDIQQSSAHMTERGAVEISRAEYLERLQDALQVQPKPLVN